MIQIWFGFLIKKNCGPPVKKEKLARKTSEKSTKIHLETGGKTPDEKKRKSSINLYQSVDEDHPDLQSIQNIVANMTFSADWAHFEENVGFIAET